MGLSQFLTKRKILALILISILIIFCYIIANRDLRSIHDSLTPLSSGNIEAMFYVENPDSGIVTCIGDGLINTTSEISGSSDEVSSAIVSSPDNSANIGDELTVSWNSIRYSEDEYRVYGTLEPVSKQATTISFANVAELKSANISSGDIVSTRGFYSEGDNGGAQYAISDNALYPVKTNISIALDNGLFANLRFNESSVLNILTFGLQPNGNISQPLNEILKTLNHKISGIKFNDGSYYFEKTVYLAPMNYYGSGQTWLAPSLDFSTDYFGVFSTDSNEQYLNISFNNLNFNYIIGPNSVRYGKSTCTMYLKNISNCEVNNCNFYAPYVPNQTLSVCNLFWIKSDYLNKLTVNKSNFINTTGESYPDNSVHLEGGCIWISGRTDSIVSNFNEITISNSNFSSNLTDELVGFWSGHFDKISITDCNFDFNGNVFNDNMITFYNGFFGNNYLSGNTFNINGKCTRVIKIYSLQDNSSCTIYNNTFNVNNNNSDHKKANEIVHFLNDTTSNTSLYIQSNKVYGATNAYYEAFLSTKNVSNKNIYLEDNYNDLEFTCYTKLMQTNNIIINATGNKINNSKRLNMIDNCTGIKYNYVGNTITSSIHNYISSQCDMDYTFNNNDISHTDKAIIQCYDITPTSNINFEFENNTIPEDQFKTFYSNNSLQKSSVFSN